MVHVGYADGSDGLEPYSGQPVDSLEVNSQGKIAVFGDLSGYMGPVSSAQLVTAAAADNKSHVYQVIYSGGAFFTDGTTGPNGGLVLWYADDSNGDAPGTDAWETHAGSPITLTVIGSDMAGNLPLTIPEGTAFQTADEYGDSTLPAYPPLYGDEAKTLSGWKGQLSEGSHISLDGANWMEVKGVSPSGAVTAQTGNGQTVFINPWSSATYVVKAPPLVDGDSPDPKFEGSPELPAELPLPSPGKKKLADFVHGDAVIDNNGDTMIIDSITPDEDPASSFVHIKVFGEDFATPGQGDFELQHLGNLTEGPVTVPVGWVVGQLYPGAKIQLSSGVNSQLVSYPEQLSNGSYRFAAIPEGQPDKPFLITVGEWNSGADLSNELAIPVHLDTFASAQDAGVNLIELNNLFNAKKTQGQPGPDHKIGMTEAGIAFGTTQYPIFYGEQSETYFRQSSDGLEEWDSETSTWSVVFGDTSDKIKVWDGAPFEGTLKAPEGFPESVIGLTSSTLDEALAAYKPKPGEAVQLAKVKMVGNKSMIVSYPQGLNGPAHTVLQHADGSLYTSAEPFAGDWKDNGAFTDLTVIHDPFAADAVDTPTTPHHEGPQPPAALGAKFQQLGYTPEPGDQFVFSQAKLSTSSPLFIKGSDGKYRRLGSNGTSASAYSLDELLAPDFLGDGSFDNFTWTYLPAGVDAPTSVGGMPDNYAPFVPSEGQAVLKVTLANGKANVYLQKQPGAGWYQMSPDGTVNESLDAVKSDHVVQTKLAKGGGSVAKYELLHPLPEGMKSAGPVAAPEFSNHAGSWTPELDQKVVALTSFSGDPDPWFFVQDENGQWNAAPINQQAPSGINDGEMQAYLTKGTDEGGGYTLVYDGASGQAAVDTPDGKLASFTGYVPQPGEQVFEEANGSHWVLTPGDGMYHPVNDDGTLAMEAWASVSPTMWKSGSDTKDLPQIWPAEDAATPAVPAAPQDFNGYTPAEGDKVIAYDPGDTGKPMYLVAQNGDLDYKPIQQGGAVNPSGGVSQSQLDAGMAGVTTVYPAPAAGAPTTGGVFAGYQTKPSDNVAQFNHALSGNQITIVQLPNGNWAPVENGELNVEDAYSQDTIDWSAENNSVEFTVLQGTMKSAPPAEAPAPLPTSTEKYAGVTEATSLANVTWTLADGSSVPGNYVKQKINSIVLQPGESAYLLGDNPFVRKSDGTWHYVYSTDGEQAEQHSSDANVEQYASTHGQTLVKIQFAAPAAAPAPVQNTYAGPAISGWADKGVPDLASFGFVDAPENVAGQPAGSWIYAVSGTGGLFVQLAEDASPTTAGSVKISAYVPVKNGVAQDVKYPTTGNPISFSLTAADQIYAQNYVGTQAAPGSSPVGTPSAPQAAVPGTPQAPAYPGAQKPSQEDINAWAGSLTKDGHIPTAGMFVTGKGPMAGKIISVSKDKTKAVVLTSDGKKTTRLIEALKTNPSANYSAYAAPVTAKDIPGGMPLAVDTVAEALDKTAKDGKFRAILNGHPGVSGGQMVVTKATAPSGKVFNRVHLTLTPAQRDQLMATLAGTGEKGDWAKTSKQSEAVAIGDQLPMRKSSTDNPDGTPRWKVDPETKPPTHTVTKVEDEAGGAGIKVVTLKNNTTGEIITSRFHTGKALTTYTWDPNKPKPVVGGAFSVSELGKAQGWQYASDGAISAISGGADNGKLYNEPGTAVTKSALGQVKSSWQTLRNVSADGVVIEIADPKGSNSNSTTGVTVVSVPEGLDETALGAALAKMGIDYRPMNQDDAKVAVRGVLRTLLSLDTSDVDTPKHYTDDQLFKQAGQTMGISDLGWQDVLVGVDESTGKTSFFWSDRARTALAAKAKYNVIYRAANTASAAQIVSTVKYGSASSILKKTTGMLDGSSSVGNGASASSDNANHAGHGSYASASSVVKLPSSNSLASYKHAGMMVYHRPEAVLGRIMDYRVANSDAFGMGQGQGSDHLKYATSMSSVRDYFLGGGLPTEAVGFIAVDSVTERDKAIAQLKADGFPMINGRPVEDIIITKQKAATLTPDDLPPVTLPANARPILDLPVSYDAPAPAAGATTGGEAAA
jgi:hypothetical protein